MKKINGMSDKILGLRTTIYSVSDIEAAKKWYAKVFEIAPYFDQPFYVGFNIGGYELGLHPEEGPVSGKKESVVAYWGVGDVHEAYNRFIASAAKEYEKPMSVGEEIMVAKVKDPWDNIIGLIYNPHFKI